VTLPSAAGVPIVGRTMKKIFRSGALAVFALLLLAQPAHAIVFGQLDNFQDGTTMGWDTGQFAPLVTNISTGGPAGAGDRYIRITADGSGAGGRLVAFNFSTWTGNYIAAGVNAISISLNNFSAVNLSIRFAFQSEIVQGGPGYLSQAMILPANSGWMNFTISLAPGSLTAVNSPTAYNTFFQNVAWTRIIHATGTTSLNGNPVTGQLGIDNIHAIPEPTTIALAAGGLLALAATFIRRRRRGEIS
jgi:hypothetical protein